jgi:quercetin dioxygenase-like cupin family protein
MNRKFDIRSAAVAALLAALGTAASADAGHKMMLAKDLKWADVPSLPPGAKLAVIEGPMNEAVPFTVRVKLPANYRLPAHFHPAVERVTTLSGVFYMGMGDKLDPAQATMALGPGDVMIMVPGTKHFAVTKEETVLQLHGTGPWGITYVDPADDPRKKQ